MMQEESHARPLRWGIAGAGAIARRFCKDVNEHASLALRISAKLVA